MNCLRLVSDIMRYKYLLLLWYLWLLSLVHGENTESKKKTDEESDAPTKSKSAKTQELLSSYERLREQVIKMVEAPDLSKIIEQEQKKREEESEAIDDESFEKLWKKQDTLFQRMVARMQNSEEAKTEKDKKKLEDEATDEDFKVFFKKQKNLLKRMIAQVQGYGNLEDAPQDVDDIGISLEMEPTSPAVDPAEELPELSPQEKAGEFLESAVSN